MTGFGSAEGTVRGGRLRIEIRTVNHRYYNPQLRLPFELTATENQIREHLRQLLDRGHVAVSARWLEPPEVAGALVVDVARARQVVAALKELKKKLHLKGDPDLAFVARHPDVLTMQANGEGAGGAGATEGAAAGGTEGQPTLERAARAGRARRDAEGQPPPTDLLGGLEGPGAGAAP